MKKIFTGVTVIKSLLLSLIVLFLAVYGIGVYCTLYLEKVWENPQGIEWEFSDKMTHTLVMQTSILNKTVNTYTDKAFYVCAGALYAGGKKIGLDYWQINVWLFCVLLVLVLLGGMVWILFLYRKIDRLERLLKEGKEHAGEK
jgi:uncharacterized protein YpmS